MHNPEKFEPQFFKGNGGLKIKRKINYNYNNYAI